MSVEMSRFVMFIDGEKESEKLKENVEIFNDERRKWNN